MDHLLAVAAPSAGAATGIQPSSARGNAWSDYHAIIWQPQNAANCAAFKQLGIDAAALIPEDRERPAENVERRIAPLTNCGLSLYVENIATDFYSAYHRWSPDKPVNWRFVEIKRAYQDDQQDRRAFMRDPSFSDPEWQKKIRDRLTETVRAYRAHRPLFYNLGDEPGIADLSAFWDFDFSPSLARRNAPLAKRAVREPPGAEPAMGFALRRLELGRPGDDGRGDEAI